MKKVLLSGTMAMLACIFLAANVLADTPVKPANPFGEPEGVSSPASLLAARPDRSVLGATINVGPAGDYTTIQAAIDAAVSGDVIVVAAGTYAEAITIDNKSLTIQGAGVGSSIVTGTTLVTQFIVKITNGAVVDFSGFTVDGTGKNIQYGVYATASTDGNIHDNEIKNVSYPGAAGIGVRRQESQIDVIDNVVYGFGRIGIYTRDDVILNTDGGVISGNIVTGLGGSDPDRLSYGISVYSGNPTVDDNEISGCVSGANVAAWASSAIDVWTGSTSALTNNYIHDSEYGIISNSASPVMSGNTFSGITEDEVRLDYFVKGNPTAHWAEYYNTIQAAIDAIPATTYPVIVWVAIYSGAGTYVEQVEVAKDCHIYGYSASSVIIQSPATLTKGWTTSTTNKPVVYIHDADDVLLGDLTVDGLGLGNANYRFIGVGFRNAGGTVWNCEVLNIRDTPFSGAQHGVAIYAYNNDTVARSITVEDCTITGFQKNGMALIGTPTTPLAVSVTGNTVTGAGATGVTAQNGIQVSDATGTVSNNTVSGIGYTGTGWVACSFLQFYGDIDFIGNTVTDSHVGIYNNYGSGDISGNNITVSLIGSYSDGIIAADPPGKLPSPIVEDGGAPAPGARMATGGTPLDVNITGNTVGFSGATNTNSYGIESYAGCSAEDLDVAVTSNTVTGFDYGVVFSACTTQPGVFTSLEVHDNSITGSTSYAMYSDITYLTADATGNWWGAQSGPYHPTLNPGGTGDAVTDNILFEPWTGMYVASVVPAHTLTNCVTPKTVTFRIDKSGTTSDQVRGYDVKFTIDNGVATAGSFVEGTYLSSVGGTTFFALNDGAGNYTVSCAILGGTVGAADGGELFSLTLTPVAAGTSGITITSFKVRDLNNAPLAAFAVDGSVEIDCTEATMDPIIEAQNGWYNTAPSLSHVGFDDNVNLDVAEYNYDGGAWTTIFSGIDAASWDSDPWILPGFDLLAEGSHTIYFRVLDDAGTWSTVVYSWQFNKDTSLPAPPTNLVALPGHNKVHLSWTNPTGDATFAGVEIRRVGWTDYPEYGTPGDPEPDYPAGPGDGDFVVLSTGAAYDDSMGTARDIYYYAAFSKDLAGNYSALDPTGTDRSTSYWLGDVTEDGLVATGDLVIFSGAFGTVSGGGGWNNVCDFGPTDDWSRIGIPLPDNRIDFEDLMIFSMNWGNVTPLGVGPVLATSPMPEALEDLVRFEIVSAGENTYSIVLKNGAATLKGVRVVVEISGGELAAVNRGAVFGGSPDLFFGSIRRDRGVELCVSALGVDAPLAASGEIARLVLKPSGDGTAAIRVAGVDLRNLANEKHEIGETEEYEAPFVPKTTALMQNYPNPFNPTTTLAFDVAKAGNVTIQIYDVSGRLVATLLNAHRAIGRHQVEWNGKNTNGSLVPSGIYFYRMRTAGYEATKKMILVR